jgi:hypothetical protein
VPPSQIQLRRGGRTITGELVHEAPAIVGRQTPSALAHAASE